jgi:ATP-dependent DNA helicase RecG
VKTSLQDLDALLKEPEGEHLEFKEAKANFHFEKLVQYCAALANEGGGQIVLGVSDKRPRVVGTHAFEQPERTVSGLVDHLRLKVEADEIAHPQGRVLMFKVPSRPFGIPLEVNGAYWMRAGESLRPMTPDELRRVVLDTGSDFVPLPLARARSARG